MICGLSYGPVCTLEAPSFVVDGTRVDLIKFGAKYRWLSSQNIGGELWITIDTIEYGSQ